MTNKAQRVLVVAAHPDDEVLGCGASLARHASAGDAVQVMFLADGEGARGGAGVPENVERRRLAAGEASRVLGCREPVHLDFPDNRLDSVVLLDVVQAVENVMREFDPTVVYVHHGGDLNVDHRIAHTAALTACRPLPAAGVHAIYAFEVMSSTGWASVAGGSAFAPTRYVDIGRFEDVKLEALQAYAGELRPFPHPRSPEALQALHRYRGAMSGLGCAEAFVVEREIVTAAT